MTTESKPAAAPVAAAKPASAPAEKPAAAPKPKAEPKPPRFHPAGTVKMLPVDKDEKNRKYGPGNDDTTVNPKRANTKSHTWFANYRDGITIKDLAAAYEKSGGSMTSNLDWDIKHKFVEYVAPSADAIAKHDAANKPAPKTEAAKS